MTQEELILKYAELKKENKRLTDLLYEQSKNLDSLNLEVERLKDGKEKAKAEIEEHETYEGIYLDRADILGIIDEYLGEVGE